MQKISTAAGFEPTRVTPSDFESDALTTRPNCRTHIIIFLKILKCNIRMFYFYIKINELYCIYFNILYIKFIKLLSLIVIVFI